MKKQKFGNRRKKQALQQMDRASLEDDANDLTTRCKFNFSYFDNSQLAGQDFSDLPENKLHNLINSLKEFCKCPLLYWEHQGTLVMYNKFPLSSEFIHPKHIPHQACWGRFRLGSKIRLVGFTIPLTLHQTPHRITKEFFDKNTFYIAFIDKDHLFWKTERK